jgi:Uncharacterized protein conserved in bacteria (DUF2344)
VASEAEYLSLALTAVCEPMRLRGVLDTALPDGIDVIDVREDSGGTLNSRLMVSEWLVELPGIEPHAAEAAASAFLAATDVHVERLTNKGVRRLDARAATVSLGQRGASPAGHAILRMVVRHTEPAVRPEDILTGLRQIAGLEPASPATVTRMAQGTIGEDGRLEPAEAGRPHQPEQSQPEHKDVP